MANKQPENRTIVAKNRKAHFNYAIEDTFEAGIVLVGSEVKSLRVGKANLADSYADEQDGEIFLRQAHIAEYSGANRFNHHPTRPRKLLLHKNQIKKLIGRLKTKGVTLVPLSIYFNEKNMVKVEMALASGKKTHDKRDTIKTREWNVEKGRLLRGKK